MALPSAKETRTSLPQQSPALGMLNLQWQMASIASGNALPRPPSQFELGEMGPWTPQTPTPFDVNTQPGREGGPAPRIWQYPVGWNLPTGPRAYEPVSFDTLRLIARQVDVVRACIQLLKDEIIQVPWKIKVKDPNRARQQGADWLAAEKQQITNFFENPDPYRGSDFGEWVKLILEEMLVTDALSIYPRRTLAKGGATPRGGPIQTDLFALQVLDGSTIKPLIDLQGGRPLAPAPAYQQYLYGVPRSEFAAVPNPALLPSVFDASVPSDKNMSTEQLIYKPYVQMANSMYGLPPVEQITITAVTYLRRELWWQSYFNDSDIPAMFLMGGDGWTPDQLERWETGLHSLMAGDPSFRWRMKTIPYGSKVEQMKQPNFDVMFDEFLLKVAAMVFRLTSSELFGMSSKSGLGGRGFLEEQAGVQDRKAVVPYRRWLESMFNRIIATEFHMPELCFEFEDKDLAEALRQAQIDDINLKNGSSFIEEVRERRGDSALEIPDAAEPYIETRAGLVPLRNLSEVSAALMAAGGGSTGIDPASGGAAQSKAGSGQAGMPIQKNSRADLEKFARFSANPANDGKEFDFGPGTPPELANALKFAHAATTRQHMTEVNHA